MTRLYTRIIGGGSLVIAACLAACFGNVAEVPPPVCTNGQQAFNGACHDACGAANPSCAVPGDRCTAIDGASALCLEASSVTCSYLGDDTECAARGGAYAFRGGWYDYASFPAGAPVDPGTLTSNVDPGFSEELPRGVFGLGDAAGVCQGNARWITVAATGSVACQASHEVRRCQLVQDQNVPHYFIGCEPVPGLTIETMARSN